MHVPVLLKETILGLDLKEGDVVLDGTVGDGGHAREVCQLIGEKGMVIGLDQDKAALSRAREKLQKGPCSSVVEKLNFRNFDIILKKLEIAKVDKILLDLGLRTGHLEESGRGFSFKHDEPLLMTFDSSPSEEVLTAYEIVNTWSKEDLAEIIKEYGEERFAWKIAEGIVMARKVKLIGTTGELVSVLEGSLPDYAKRGRLHFATKTFQALRIATNDEIGALKEVLEKGVRYLTSGGRIAIISFHSLEDRIVKRFFKEKSKEEDFLLITKKPIIAGSDEVGDNPRARSAKLRILEKS